MALTDLLAANNTLVVYAPRCSFNLIAIYVALPAHVDSTSRSWDLVVGLTIDCRIEDFLRKIVDYARRFRKIVESR